MSSEFEINNGTVVFEIDIFLSSDSGRPKHTDIENQGGFLMIPIERGLRAYEPGPGAGFGMLRYMGAGSTGRRVISEQQVGPVLGPFPVDEARDNAYALQSVVRALSAAVLDLIEAAPDPQAAWQSLGDRFETRDVPNVVAWATNDDAAALDGIEMPDWRDALLWRPVTCHVCVTTGMSDGS